MGFLKGKVSGVASTGCEVTLDAGTKINLPFTNAQQSVGDAVTLGIRPEHLELAKEGDCQLKVVADVSERLGSDTYCHVRTASGEALTLRIRGDLASQYGETLNLHLDSTHCHLFDAQGQVIRKALQAAA
jgi:multiple sugar transport system ATP-binding protein